MTATTPWHLTSWMLQPAHGLCQQFWSYGQQLFDESMYLQVDQEIVFPPSGSNSTQQLDTVIFMWTKYTRHDFRLLPVRNLTEEAGKSQDRPTPRLVGRPCVAATNVVRLESHHNQPWPAKSYTQFCCLLCSSCGQTKGTVYKCISCDVGLSMVPCFAEYHTKVNL